MKPYQSHIFIVTQPSGIFCSIRDASEHAKSMKGHVISEIVLPCDPRRSDEWPDLNPTPPQKRRKVSENA